MANLIELSEPYILKRSKSLPIGDKPEVTPLASGLHHWTCKTYDFSAVCFFFSKQIYYLQKTNLKIGPTWIGGDSSPISNTHGDSDFVLLD